MKTDDIIDAVDANFPGELLGRGSHAGQGWAVLRAGRLEDVFRFLKEDPDIKLDFLVDITAVDYSPREPRFEVVYHLYSMTHGHRLRIKAPVEEADASVPTLCGVFRTANWHERETYDMFGIRFDGHPDLRRILMPDEFEGHPLRKDFPLAGRGWKFEPWPDA